jgi:hypothetical protein
MSTGGAPMKAIMKQVVAASKVGIIRTPNQPTYRRLSVEVTHWQNCCQGFVCLCKAIVAVVIEIKRVVMSSGERTSEDIPTPPSSVGKKTYLNSHRSWLTGM